MEQAKKMIARYFSSAFALARFVNLNKIEQHQIVQISETRDYHTLFFYSENPLEFDRLWDLFDYSFINNLKNQKLGFHYWDNKVGCYIIPTYLKDCGENLTREEWIEILCKFNDTEDYQTVR